MKKLLYGIIATLVLAIAFMVTSVLLPANQTKKRAAIVTTSAPINQKKTKGNYSVYQYDRYKKAFTDYEAALEFAMSIKKSYIIDEDQQIWVWDSFKDYIVYSQGIYIGDYENFRDAYKQVQTYKKSYITYKDNYHIIYNRDYIKPKAQIISDVQNIYQNPQLPRGCEVTALAILMNYRSFNITKMELAKAIRKEPGIYTKRGQSFYGNPEQGFVGDMYKLTQFGFGVFDQPIENLAQQYADPQVLNLSHNSFESVLTFIGLGNPVWVITNTAFKELPEERFMTWNTEEGDMKITNKHHAVVITGYDANYIYIKDPLGIKRKVNREDFIAAWEQMGQHAITIIDPTKTIKQ